MDPKNFFAELKRRNVYKSAVAYAVMSWLIIQVATQIFPVFTIPAWAVRLVIIFVILGFPIALVLAWIFELTPEGLKRTEEAGPHESSARSTGRKLDFLIIAVLLFVITLLVLDRRGSTPAQPQVAAFEKSVAVLPFENMSDEKENAFFADGVQDDILTALAKVADLRVISRTSVMGYPPNANRDLREIGRALGVAHVLEGSVRRDGGRVRVAAQLIDTRTNTQLWAESYDRELADVFAIQSEIAQNITRKLQATLSPSENPRSRSSLRGISRPSIFIPARKPRGSPPTLALFSRKRLCKPSSSSMRQWRAIPSFCSPGANWVGRTTFFILPATTTRRPGSLWRIVRSGRLCVCLRVTKFSPRRGDSWL